MPMFGVLVPLAPLVFSLAGDGQEGSISKAAGRITTHALGCMDRYNILTTLIHVTMQLYDHITYTMPPHHTTYLRCTTPHHTTPLGTHRYMLGTYITYLLAAPPPIHPWLPFRMFLLSALQAFFGPRTTNANTIRLFLGPYAYPTWLFLGPSTYWLFLGLYIRTRARQAPRRMQMMAMDL